MMRYANPRTLLFSEYENKNAEVAGAI